MSRSVLLSQERRQLILEALESQQAVQVSQLAERFGVSEVTVRRDLNELMRLHNVERVYGGAVLTPREMDQPSIGSREVMNQGQKQRIGRAAAEFVQDGDTIIIGGGTTTAELARNLTERRDLMVITPALNIATILAQSRHITLLVTGGILVGPEVTLAGYYGEQTLRGLHADKLFLGACVFDPKIGLTSAHPSELGVNRAMIEAADQRFLLVDHSKLRRVSTCLIGETDELDYVITDDSVPDEVISQLEEMDIHVVRA